MHIAFITSEYPLKHNLNSGGIGSFISNLSNELTNLEHQVTIFLYSQLKDEILYENGVEIHFIKRKSLKPFTWWFNRKKIEKYINKVINKNKIEIIEAPDWTGVTAFMKFSCPLVLRLHGSDAFFCDLENRKQKAKNFFYEKKALLNADGIIGVSNFVANKTKKIFSITKKITVIYNAINSDKFKPTKIEIQKDSILYFGSILRKKGILELAHIFNLLILKNPKAILYLLGKDVYDIKEKKSTLELFKSTLSEDSKKSVVYLNEVKYNEVKEYILKSEVVVLPSFAEAFPMTWLEAMSLEKKMVTSNIGWANELMINNITGFTENPKDHKNFANKIAYLLNNDIKSNEMAKNARKRILDNFDLKILAKKNLQFYKSLI